MADANIVNSLGHTVFPKWVYPNGEKKPGVIVNDADEESKAMGAAKKPVAAPAVVPAAWPEQK